MFGRINFLILKLFMQRFRLYNYLENVDYVKNQCTNM